MRGVRISWDPVMDVKLTEEHIDYLDEVADNRGISRAALLRKWIAAGERAESAVIPDFEETSSGPTAHRDPVEQLFLNELPDTADEAMSVDQMRSKLKEKIDAEVMTLYRESEDIALTDKGDIYADAE